MEDMKETLKGLACLAGVIISIGVCLCSDSDFCLFLGIASFIICVQLGVKWAEKN